MKSGPKSLFCTILCVIGPFCASPGSSLLASCGLAVDKTVTVNVGEFALWKSCDMYEVANSPSPSSLIVQRVEQIRRRNWPIAYGCADLGADRPHGRPHRLAKSTRDREERLMAWPMWKPVLANPTPNGNQGWSRTRLRNGYIFVRIEATDIEIGRRTTAQQDRFSRGPLPPES
jgi:hypothetical protein